MTIFGSFKQLRVTITVCVSAGLMYAGATAGAADSPEEYAHSFVEYPYSSDGQGSDLPVVIGTFRVRAQHGTAGSAEKRIQLGYTRYLAADDNKKEAIVFLSDGIDDSGGRLGLYSALRANADVIILNRRGSGLSVPPVECGILAYPLSFPLLIVDLRSAARLFANDCSRRWLSADISPDALKDVEVTGDLYDLALVTDRDRLHLVVDASMIGLGVIITHRNDNLISSIVLIDPIFNIDELAARHMSRVSELGAEASDAINKLNAKLTGSPVAVKTTTITGTPAEITIGTLDLAFVVARLFSNPGGPPPATAAILAAVDGNFSALGTYALEIRKTIGTPGNALLQARVNASQDPGLMENDELNFALAWPATVFPVQVEVPQISKIGASILVVRSSTTGDLSTSNGFISDNVRAEHVPFAGTGDSVLDNTEDIAPVIRKFVDSRESERTPSHD